MNYGGLCALDDSQICGRYGNQSSGRRQHWPSGSVLRIQSHQPVSESIINLTTPVCSLLQRVGVETHYIGFGRLWRPTFASAYI